MSCSRISLLFKSLHFHNLLLTASYASVQHELCGCGGHFDLQRCPRGTEVAPARVTGEVARAFPALRLETDIHRRKKMVDASDVVGPGARHHCRDIVQKALTLQPAAH